MPESRSGASSGGASPTRLTAQQIIEQLLNQLLDVLSEEVRLTRTMLDQAQTVQRHLLADDYNALLGTAQEQDTFARRLRQSEHQRLLLMHRLSPYLPGLKEARLSEWVRRLPEPFASRLRDVRAALALATAGLQRVNRQNTALIQRSLRFAEMALGVESATYGSTRAQNGYGSESPQLFDTTL